MHIMEDRVDCVFVYNDTLIVFESLYSAFSSSTNENCDQSSSVPLINQTYKYVTIQKNIEKKKQKKIERETQTTDEKKLKKK